MNEQQIVKGGLVLKLTDENFVTVGDTKIYLDRVIVSGKNGGRPIVQLRFTGPRETVIKRHYR